MKVNREVSEKAKEENRIKYTGERKSPNAVLKDIFLNPIMITIMLILCVFGIISSGGWGLAFSIVLAIFYFIMLVGRKY